MTPPNKYYELERACLLLRSANFNVVKATEEEQESLRVALDLAEESLVERRHDMRSTFRELTDAIYAIGRKPHQQNQWVWAVARRINNHFAGRLPCSQCGGIL